MTEEETRNWLRQRQLEYEKSLGQRMQGTGPKKRLLHAVGDQIHILDGASKLYEGEIAAVPVLLNYDEIPQYLVQTRSREIVVPEDLIFLEASDAIAYQYHFLQYQRYLANAEVKAWKKKYM